MCKVVAAERLHMKKVRPAAYVPAMAAVKDDDLPVVQLSYLLQCRTVKVLSRSVVLNVRGRVKLQLDPGRLVDLVHMLHQRDDTVHHICVPIGSIQGYNIATRDNDVH